MFRIQDLICASAVSSETVAGIEGGGGAGAGGGPSPRAAGVEDKCPNKKRKQVKLRYFKLWGDSNGDENG